jgi:hypothetical protein
MPGLMAAWRSIVRALERSNIADSSDPAICSNDNRRRILPLVMQRTGSRVRGVLELVRHRMHQARSRRNELWLEALQSAYTVRDERRAKRRALSLLMRLLSPEQRQEFRQYRYFHVTGASSGDRYRIRIDLIANIDVLDDNGKVWHRLCVHPAGAVPLYDVMASQLLQLQDPIAEVRLLQQANVFPPLTEVSWYSMPGRHT